MAQNLVVVQAASGVLGSHVVKDLLDNGFSVRAIVRAGSSQEKLSMLHNLRKQHNNLEIAEVKDVNDQNEFDRMYRDARFAVFSASPYRVDLPQPERYQNDVISSLRNSFRCIQKYQNNIKKVIYVASIAALIDLDNLVQKKEAQIRPATPSDRNDNPNLKEQYQYDFLQRQALDEVQRLKGELSIPTHFIYAGFPIGPMLETSRRAGNVIDWANLYLRGSFDAKRQRVYCYSNVQDVAFGIRKLLSSDQYKAGHDFIIAEDHPTHPMKVYDAFRNYKQDLIKWKPSNEERQRMLEDAQRFKSMTALDISKTQSDLGLRPQDSEKTLSVMIKSMVEQNLLSGVSA